MTITDKACFNIMKNKLSRKEVKIPPARCMDCKKEIDLKNRRSFAWIGDGVFFCRPCFINHKGV